MTKQHFIQLLGENQINEELVSFGPAYRDGYCIRKNHICWEVFVRERGQEYDLLGFPSESDALQYLYGTLLRIYGTRSTGDGLREP